MLPTLKVETHDVGQDCECPASYCYESETLFGHCSFLAERQMSTHGARKRGLWKAIEGLMHRCRVSPCSDSSIQKGWEFSKWVHPGKAEVLGRMNQSRQEIACLAEKLRRERLDGPHSGQPPSDG